jgi:hypothetical protein
MVVSAPMHASLGVPLLISLGVRRYQGLAQYKTCFSGIALCNALIPLVDVRNVRVLLLYVQIFSSRGIDARLPTSVLPSIFVALWLL